jgi:hypothetical protein
MADHAGAPKSRTAFRVPARSVSLVTAATANTAASTKSAMRTMAIIGQGRAQIPPLQIPDAHTLPQLPQLFESDCMSAQYLLVPDPQTWPGGQQSGGMPGGGMRKATVLSATIPGGQQSSGFLL